MISRPEKAKAFDDEHLFASRSTRHALLLHDAAIAASRPCNCCIMYKQSLLLAVSGGGEGNFPSVPDVYAAMRRADYAPAAQVEPFAV